MKIFRKIWAFILILSMVAASAIPAFGAVDARVEKAINNTAAFILKTLPDVEVGSVGGEWAIIGLARSDYEVSDKYFNDYYKKVEEYVRIHKGILHDKKYTEYSRIILAVSAIGKNPSSVAGYNLLEPLGDFNKTIWQGINGPIFALISLDSGDYEIPICPSAEVQATREMYISEILSRQLPDGGFALSGNISDPDITGMALQALAKYQGGISVKSATEKALTCLSNMQDKDGGFSYRDEKTSESTAQVLMALCELGININDERFVKNGITLLDNLLSYYDENQGFRHTLDGSGSTGMSAEQCFYALVNYERTTSGMSSLYRMGDTLAGIEAKYSGEFISSNQGSGLPGKIEIINAPAIIHNGKNKVFNDINGHGNYAAITALASRGIIAGFDDLTFAPEKSVTRAEFATIMTKALGLPSKNTDKFLDIADQWHAPFVGSVNFYGIASGKAENLFAPNDTITRQEAAVMVANAAKLCGINTDLGDTEIRDMLAQFPDYTASAQWARSGLALCYKENILSQDVMEIKPLEPINRGEIAEMVYNLLAAANLL